MDSTYFKRYRMEVDLSVPRFAPALPTDYRLVPWNEAVLDIHARTKFRSFRDEIDSVVFPWLGSLGTCLIERCLAGFRMHGLQRVSLEVTVENAGAVRLYQRLGFRRVRTVYKVVDEAAVMA